MDAEWIRRHTLGGNTYAATQGLIASMQGQSFGRILDLGCGKCLSSAVLAEAFDAEVWAVDIAADPGDNLRMLRELGEKRVYPLQLDARRLPFAPGFFDAIVAVNSIYYFGTDDKFLPYISRFLVPGGILAATDICFTREPADDIPDFLQADYPYYFQHLHSPEWWRRHWAKTALLDELQADLFPDSQELKAEYLRQTASASDAFTRALERDCEGLLGFFRIIGKKNALEPFLEEF